MPGLCAYRSAKWPVSGFSLCVSVNLMALGMKAISLEPGGMQMDWAGSIMDIHPITHTYKKSVGAVADMFRTQF